MPCNTWRLPWKTLPKKTDVNMRATEFQSIIDSARRALRAAQQAKTISEAAAEHFATEVGVMEACVLHLESKLPLSFRPCFDVE